MIHLIPIEGKEPKLCKPELIGFRFTTCLLCDLEQDLNISGSVSSFEKWEKEYLSHKLVLRIVDNNTGTSLVVQWLRLWATNAGVMALIPGHATKIPHAARHGQIKYNGCVLKKKERKKIIHIMYLVLGTC